MADKNTKKTWDKSRMPSRHVTIDDYVVSTFNAGIGNTTLPLYIYSAIKFGVSPAINAISTIIVALTAVAIFLAWRFGRLSGAEPQSAGSADQAAAG